MPTPASQEIVTVVDDRNRMVANLPRHRVRSENLIHRATYIFVLDRRGRVLVRRRTAIKDMYPSYYDLAAGGTVAAGETYEACAEREAAEELGIRSSPLETKFDFYYEDERNRCFGRVFACVYEGPFTLQAEEVESVAFHDVDEIVAGAIAPSLPTPCGRSTVSSESERRRTGGSEGLAFRDNVTHVPVRRRRAAPGTSRQRRYPSNPNLPPRQTSIASGQAMPASAARA